MTLAELKKEVLKEYKESLDSNSKFFKQDVQSFKERLATTSDKDRLTTQLGNLQCLNGKSREFNSLIQSLTDELEKGGMYSVGGMEPKNALD